MGSAIATRLLLLTLVASAACSGEAPEAPVRRAVVRSPIVAGRSNGADPALGALLAGSKTFCSGVAVSPRLVLTAAHCALGQPSAVRFSADGGEDIEIAVADAVAHPEYARGTLANDLAVLILEGAAPDLEPLPVFTFDPTWVGARVRLAGFGVTSPGAGDGGEKREGMSSITSYDTTTFHVAASPAATCGGDSGGPVFLSAEAGERWIGITSSGDVDCAQFSRVMRLDAYAEFLGRLSPCTDTDDCPEDSECALGICRPPAPVPLELGAPCEADRQCRTGFCAQGLGTCAARCLGGESSCVEGASCEELAGELVCVRLNAIEIDRGCSVVVSGRSSFGSAATQLFGWVAIALRALVRRRRARRTRVSTAGAWR
jgi:hypothetical protein